MWIRAIILLTPFMVPVTAAYGSDEATAALECAEWANKVFFAPSSARDGAFIDCIMKRSSFSVRADLRHRLDTGEGDEVLHRFATGEDSPVISEYLATNPPIDSDCPYLAVTVLTPIQGGNADERRMADKAQKPYMKKFLAHLERVGFKAWEPLSARLEREGFKELGAFRAKLWGESDENPAKRTARETEEAEKILAKLARDDQVKVKQILEKHQRATWLARSSVLDIGGSELLGFPEGDRLLVWNWSMEKKVTLLDGKLRLDLFKDPTDYDPHRQFGSITNHLHTMKSDFGMRAAEAADWAASVFLPHARQLCADMNVTLLEEEAALERIRDQLTEEIIRVRERRAEQEKQLKLEVEQ